MWTCVRGGGGGDDWLRRRVPVRARVRGCTRVRSEARVTNVPVHGTRGVIYCLVRAVIYRVLINLILRMKYDNNNL